MNCCICKALISRANTINEDLACVCGQIYIVLTGRHSIQLSSDQIALLQKDYEDRLLRTPPTDAEIDRVRDALCRQDASAIKILDRLVAQSEKKGLKS